MPLFMDDHEASGGKKYADIPVEDPMERGTTSFTATSQNQELSTNVTMGRWRHGICGWFRAGCCNLMTLLACCCTPLALGCVTNRMQLDACGRKSSQRNIFWKTLLVLTLTTLFARLAINYCTGQYRIPKTDEHGNIVFPETPIWVSSAWVIHSITQMGVPFYILILMIRTRSYIRRVYQIPESTCRGCEDCCCSFWLPSCTVLQMSRQLRQYDTSHDRCCSRQLPRTV